MAETAATDRYQGQQQEYQQMDTIKEALPESPDSQNNQEKPYTSMAYEDSKPSRWTPLKSLLERILSLIGATDFYRFVRKYSFSFIGVHYMYIVGMTIVTSIIMYADRGDRKLNYIDALFFGAAASTQAGLNTVNVGEIYLYQQVVLIIVAFITSIVTIHSAVVFVRIYWFQKHFENIEANSKLQSRLRRTATMARAGSQDAESGKHLGFVSSLSNRFRGNRQRAGRSDPTLIAENELLGGRNGGHNAGLGQGAPANHNNDHGGEPSSNPGLVPQSERNIQFGALPNPRRQDEILPVDMFKSISMMQQTRRESSDLTDGPALVIKSPRDIAREYERRRAERKRQKASEHGTTSTESEESNMDDDDRNISLIAEAQDSDDDDDDEVIDDGDSVGSDAVFTSDSSNSNSNSEEEMYGNENREALEGDAGGGNHESDEGSIINGAPRADGSMNNHAAPGSPNKLRFDSPKIPRRHPSEPGFPSHKSYSRTNTQGSSYSRRSGPRPYYSRKTRRRDGRTRKSRNSSDDESDEDDSGGNRNATSGRSRRRNLNRSISLDRFMGRTRSNTSLTRTNSKGMRTNYLSWEPTVGRNSAFVGLTKEQREELGGVEYRALKLLAKILVAYNTLLPLFGMVCLLPWANVKNQVFKTMFGEGGFNSSWWAIFSSFSSFSDLGLTLTANSFISFQHQVFVLLVSSFLILTGNTGFPCFLRLLLWVLFKVTPKYGVMHENLGFLLDHPRRCFTLLFPSSATWWLLFVLVILNGLDWFFFMVVDLGSTDIIASIPVGFRTMCGLYQAIATRTAGFAVVPLGELHPAVQVSYLIMMYISVFPVAISMRRTNVYEEQSLGVYYDPEELEEAESAGEFHPSYVQVHLRKQLSFDLWFIFLGLFIICLCESGHIRNKEYDVFAVLFEVVSAYGTVGLSLGYPNFDPSLSGRFNVLSKLVIIAMMIRGRHRGLPYALDRAIMVKGEDLTKTDRIQQERTIRKRVMSSAVPISDQISQVGGLTTGVELFKTATTKTKSSKDTNGIKNLRKRKSLDGNVSNTGDSAGSGSVTGIRESIRRDLRKARSKSSKSKRSQTLLSVPSQVITD